MAITGGPGDVFSAPHPRCPEHGLMKARKGDVGNGYTGTVWVCPGWDGEGCDCQAARKRKMRPQKPFYKDMPESVATLFDACCTAKERAKAEEQDAAFWLHVVHNAKKAER